MPLVPAFSSLQMAPMRSPSSARSRLSSGAQTRCRTTPSASVKTKRRVGIPELLVQHEHLELGAFDEIRDARPARLDGVALEDGGCLGLQRVEPVLAHAAAPRAGDPFGGVGSHPPAHDLEDMTRMTARTIREEVHRCSVETVGPRSPSCELQRHSHPLHAPSRGPAHDRSRASFPTVFLLTQPRASSLASVYNMPYS